MRKKQAKKQPFQIANIIKFESLFHWHIFPTIFLLKFLTNLVESNYFPIPKCVVEMTCTI